jgi:endoglucanase
LYNSSTVSQLANNWNATVVRAPMGIDVEGGYLSDPAGSINKISTIVDAAINQGIYVIIDWHEEKATTHVSQAVNFFKIMAQKYGDKPNVIYEIYNEPTSTSWSDIKSYSQQVINGIRQYDPDNIIVVGTPNWSQDVDVAANDPIQGTNIMYTLHFYAGTHKQWLRDKATNAINKGIALFATEWGTCDASGNSNLDLNESNTWLNYLDSNGISWCNWSLNTKAETASALTTNANLTGPWSDSELTDSGKYVKSKLTSSIPPQPSTGIVSGGTYKIINVNSGKALDSDGTGDGANVQQWSYGGGNNQKWIVTDVGEGKYKIINVASGRALDCAGNWDGANVQIWSYGGGNNQKWYLNDMGSGQYRLIGVDSGKALDGAGNWDGANVQIWFYGGGNNQKWTFVKLN